MTVIPNCPCFYREILRVWCHLWPHQGRTTCAKLPGFWLVSLYLPYGSHDHCLFWMTDWSMIVIWPKQIAMAVFNWIVSFIHYLMFTENVLTAFTEPFSVRHYHVNVVFFIVVKFVVAFGVGGGVCCYLVLTFWELNLDNCVFERHPLICSSLFVAVAS